MKPLRFLPLAALFGAASLAAAPESAPAHDLTWEELGAKYPRPAWYRDGKLGIWAHWGPQAQPGHGGVVQLRLSNGIKVGGCCQGTAAGKRLSWAVGQVPLRGWQQQ